MVGVLASSAVDCGFEPLLGQTKDYDIGTCCSSAKHASLRGKDLDWLFLIYSLLFEVRHQYNFMFR
jgi:hypothetical protein